MSIDPDVDVLMRSLEEFSNSSRAAATIHGDGRLWSFHSSSESVEDVPGSLVGAMPSMVKESSVGKVCRQFLAKFSTQVVDQAELDHRVSCAGRCVVDLRRREIIC